MEGFIIIDTVMLESYFVDSNIFSTRSNSLTPSVTILMIVENLDNAISVVNSLFCRQNQRWIDGLHLPILEFEEHVSFLRP